MTEYIIIQIILATVIVVSIPALIVCIIQDHRRKKRLENIIEGLLSTRAEPNNPEKQLGPMCPTKQT